MRILFNPKDGAPVTKAGFKPVGDEPGYFIEFGVGTQMGFADDAAKFLIDTYPFLKDVTEEYEKTSPESAEKVEEYEPKKFVPNLVDQRLHPEKYRDVETRSKDFYGPGLEEDTKEGITLPKSKFH